MNKNIISPPHLNRTFGSCGVMEISSILGKKALSDVSVSLQPARQEKRSHLPGILVSYLTFSVSNDVFIFRGLLGEKIIMN